MTLFFEICITVCCNNQIIQTCNPVIMNCNYSIFVPSQIMTSDLVLLVSCSIQYYKDMFSLADILQIPVVICWVVFLQLLLFLGCSLAILTLQNMWNFLLLSQHYQNSWADTTSSAGLLSCNCLFLSWNSLPGSSIPHGYSRQPVL